MPDVAYLVPLRHGAAEITEKRSRFIGQVWPVASEEEARVLIAETKAVYHDARHNCWCYILRAGSGGPAAVRYADDGEPQGTAGQPMLEVLRRAGAENVLCVVTRYFGGILLGTGGLTRAYSQAAKLALESAGLAEMRPMTIVALVCPYGLLDRVRNEIGVFGGTVDEITYAEEVTLTASFDEERAGAFLSRVTDVTAGAVAGTRTGVKFAAAGRP